jgi:hypothetical protein
MTNMVRWNTPAPDPHAVMANGRATAATTATTSSGRDLRPRRRPPATARTPNAKAKPMAVAKAEWRRSSVRSKIAAGYHGRAENAATAVMQTPKPTCSAVAGRRHIGPAWLDCHSTPKPNSKNPRRAIQAPGTPWAADSLVVCCTHEYDSGMATGATPNATAEPTNITTGPRSE